jgi:hypothetical protein
VTIDQRVQVRQTEAALLRDANDNRAAYDVLKQALVSIPICRTCSMTRLWSRKSLT